MEERLQQLPLELFEFVASYLPAEDFGSLRRADKETLDKLQYSFKVRVGPVRTLKNAAEDSLTRLLEANYANWRQKITALQISEESIVETLQGMHDAADGDGNVYFNQYTSWCRTWQSVIAGFPNLEVVILNMTDDDMDIEERESIHRQNRAFTTIAHAIHGRRIKVHFTSPYWDFVVFWEGNAQISTKVRILGGHNTGTMLQLTNIDPSSQSRLAANLKDIKRYFCENPDAVEFSGFDFEAFAMEDVRPEESAAMMTFLINPRQLVVKRCQLTGYLRNGFDFWLLHFVERKSLLDIHNCTMRKSTIQNILNGAANPMVSPNLTHFRFERIHAMLFEWEPQLSPGIYDEGQRLQEYIPILGFREAIALMRRSLREVNDDKSLMELSTTWLGPERGLYEEETPVQRLLRNKAADQEFYANHRKG